MPSWNVHWSMSERENKKEYIKKRVCLFDTPSFFFLILLVEVQTLLDSGNLLHSSIGATLVAAGTLEGRILDLAVELDLWLGTGRTDTDLRAILTEPLQHVRRSWHINLTGRAIGILLLRENGSPSIHKP